MGSGIKPSRVNGLLAVIAGLAAAWPTLAQVDPASGIDFVTVGAVSNPAWPGMLPIDATAGRGSVAYEYRIGRYEVTTAQWAEFFNAAFDRPPSDFIPWLPSPNQINMRWGATSTVPNTPGGQRWTVPAGNEMRGASNISWRTAAIYCNWLHNGKGTNREAFLSGAYDVSTFGNVGNGFFSDQLVRSPGAQYYIPNYDEWVKASHYDPNRVNQDGTIGGWWRYSDMSDDPLVYGPPGSVIDGVLAQANAWTPDVFQDVNPFIVPLGSYETRTPWGLIDAAGMTSEWLEDAFVEASGLGSARYYDGSAWRFGPGSGIGRDSATGRGGGSPASVSFEFGLRIAAVIPSPSTGALVAGALLGCTLQRRRSSCKRGDVSCKRGSGSP